MHINAHCELCSWSPRVGCPVNGIRQFRDSMSYARLGQQHGVNSWSTHRLPDPLGQGLVVGFCVQVVLFIIGLVIAVCLKCHGAVALLQSRSEWIDIDMELEAMLNQGYAKVKALLERNRWVWTREKRKTR